MLHVRTKGQQQEETPHTGDIIDKRLILLYSLVRHIVPYRIHQHRGTTGIEHQIFLTFVFVISQVYVLQCPLRLYII